MEHNLSTDYKKLSLSEKLNFFDSRIANEIQYINENELYQFLKEIILDQSENSYIRKLAQTVFIECVFLKKIKVRHALSLLIDDWIQTPEVFLEMQRVKDLYYFYDDEPNEIEKIFTSFLDNEELEIASEAFLNLGLVNMQKGFSAKTKEERILFFCKSEDYLIQADQLIENRVDARYYSIVVSMFKDSLNGLKGDFKRQLDNLAELLYKKELYSFEFKSDSFELSFYRVLFSLFTIEQENPDRWLDYTKGFAKLHSAYSEIKNQQVKDRLNKSVVSATYIEMVNKEFIEPYFALNYNSQLSKIDSYLDEQEPNSPLHDFLVYIKALTQDKDLKKKAATDSIKQRLVNSFPKRSTKVVEDAIVKMSDINDSFELLNVFEELNQPTIEKFIDELIYSCVSLQRNRTYRGNFSEDDRNTQITDLLDGDNYRTKDQTRQGTSAKGKSAGEIDILIKDCKGLPFAIIEALNLKYLWKEYIITHIDKIFGYDTTGFENNFILVYADIKDFGKFWKEYINFVSKHNYKYTFKDIEDIIHYNYSDIRIARGRHIRQGKEVFLYHIGINLFNT